MSYKTSFYPRVDKIDGSQITMNFEKFIQINSIGNSMGFKKDPYPRIDQTYCFKVTAEKKTP